ncbi:MAG: cyclic nucleotide-binding domain-containing protein [Magnetococcales bacterium]|nr:cyclic nucleotide-binding domain-containing protein [Magnetococcales bacterium]
MPPEPFREMGKHYPAGSVIYQQGESAQHFFVVQEGQVVITRETSSGQCLLVEPGPGEVFGIVSLFTPSQKRFTTATAKTEARVLRVDARVFISRLHQDPSLAFRIIRHLSQRICDLDHCVAGMESRKPDQAAHRDKKLLNVHDFSVEHHFLIVEDELEFFMLMSAWLHEEDETDTEGWLPTCKLTLATTFHEAEQLLGQEKYDLILLDLHLSDSNGYEETFVRINEMAFDTPVIVFTALDDDKKALQAVHEGAQDYLIKGQVTGRSFKHAVYHALSRHHFMRQASPSEAIDTSQPPPSRHFLGWPIGTWHRNMRQLLSHGASPTFLDRQEKS